MYFPTLTYLYTEALISSQTENVFRVSCKRIPSIETYPASEGFMAYQDTQTEEGLLLCVN